MSGARKAFTLTELLVVVVIVMILLALVTVPLKGLFESQRITSAAETIQGRIEFARMWALSNNKPAEIRFFEITKANQTPSLTIVLFDSLEGKLISDQTNLPNGVRVADARPLSTLIQKELMPLSGTMDLGDRGSYPYVGFTCLADGSTDLAPRVTNLTDGIWTITIVGLQTASVSTLPNNYAMVQVMPTNARTRIWRP